MAEDAQLGEAPGRIGRRGERGRHGDRRLGRLRSRGRVVHEDERKRDENDKDATAHVDSLRQSIARHTTTGYGRGVKRDLQLIDRLERLHPAVVADCLDRLGARNQVLDPAIRPLYPEAKLAGYAATVHCVPMDGVPASREDWYSGELAAIDSLEPGDVMVVSTCKGSYWGELLATASRYRGARGIVVDAYTRDTLALIEMQFPTFAAGIHCADSLGRIDVQAFGVEITCGGVTVANGDLVLADNDGVVIVPAAIAGEAITLAEEKIAGETLVRQKLEEGMSVAEAFRVYGVI